jgi:TonB-linked SusC/RagA family outer membrane protein
MHLTALCKGLPVTRPVRHTAAGTKTWLIMKLTSLLLVVISLQVSAAGSAQTVNFSAKNVSVEKVFAAIEKQTGYVFFLDVNNFDINRKINVDWKNKSLHEALDNCIQDQSVAYSIVGKTIVIKKKDPAELPALPMPPVPVVIEVNGRVTGDAGNPLSGVSVFSTLDNRGTTTDEKGNFTISVSPTATLRFTYVGYQLQDVPVKNQTTLVVVLKPVPAALNDVVVIGYGTQRRSDITGAVASVDVQKLAGTPIRSIDQALQGRVAGVTFTQNSGMPGAGSAIRVRGGNSINGSNEPLYVIDGVPVFADQGSDATSLNPMNSISPADVESIEILKDASATSIYGSRGGNGVILVTTKRGRRDRTAVTLDSYYGNQTILKRYSLLNAAQFEQLANEASVAEGGAQLYDPTKTPVTTDWQSYLFRESPIQSHSLSVSGGDQKSRYLISANYFDQDGIVRSSDLKRYSFRANYDRDVRDNVKIGTSLTVSNVRTNRVNSGSLFTMATTAPNLPVKQADGSYTSLNNQAAPFDNPVALVENYKNFNNTFRSFGNAYASMEIVKNLTVKTLWGVDVSYGRNDTYLPQAVYSGSQVGGDAAISTTQTFTWLNENTINYVLNKNQHHLDILAGYTQQSATYQSLGASTQAFLNDNLGTNALGNGALVQPSSSSIATWSLVSYLGRINYGFQNKYLLTLTGRYDGSSRFGKNNRFGFFPSAAFAWKMEQEDFVKNLHVFSNLKLRVSHGLTGNQDGIGNSPSLDLMGTSNYTIGGVNVIGLAPSQVGNPDLKWESTAQTDLGLEFGFFNNRLTFVADVYYKTTRDLLLNVKIPTTSGFATSLQNRGKVENKGFEFSVNAVPLEGKFRWTTSFNISFNRNKILDLAGVNQLFAGLGPNQSTILQVGQPLGTFYGYVADGLFQTTAEIAASAQTTAKPGDIRFKDFNGDKKINDADRTILGNAQPKYTGGFINSFSYKGFDLTVLLQGSYGNSLYNINRGTLENLTGLQNQSATTLDRWTPTHTNTIIPRATSLKPTARSWDRAVEDGSYLRLKNLQLAYNFSAGALKGLGFNSLRVYANIQNLFTITKYSGLDPEVSRYASDNTSPGFDSGAYPNARTLTFGINVSL